MRGIILRNSDAVFVEGQTGSKKHSLFVAYPTNLRHLRAERLVIAALQRQARCPPHVVHVVPIHHAAKQANLVVLPMGAAVRPRESMRAKPLRNVLEESEHILSRAQNTENFPWPEPATTVA